MKAIKTLQIISFENKFFIQRPLLNFNELIKSKNLMGIKLQLKGRLKGVKRAKKIELMRGKIKAQCASFPIQAKKTPIQTKWGKLGMQVILG